MSELLVHKNLATRASCSICDKELYGELYVLDIGFFDYGGDQVGYQCQNCEKFLCSDCEKNHVKHRLLGDWHKKKSKCPNCDHSFYPSPAKTIVQRKRKEPQTITSELKIDSQYLDKLTEIPENHVYCILDTPEYILKITGSKFIADYKQQGGESYSIPFDDIFAVDIGSGKALKLFGLYRLYIKVKSENNEQDWIQLNASMNFSDIYRFAKILSEAAAVPFCKPTVIGKTNNDYDLIEFHIMEGQDWSEEGIVWPQVCSACMGEDNVRIEKTEIKRGTSKGELASNYLVGSFFGTVLSTKVGPQSVTYLIPRCESCKKNKKIGVQFMRFDGARAIAEFRNHQYAEEFLGIND